MFLGIDVGTSEVKVLLLDSKHHVIGVSGSSLEISRPHSGHSEQDPAAWWIATQLALAELKQQVSPTICSYQSHRFVWTNAWCSFAGCKQPSAAPSNFMERHPFS